MQKTATIDDIVAMTKDDPERFASSLLGEEPTQRTGMQVRYFDNQSLVVNTGGPSQGRFYNFTDPDAKGDMLDLVRWHRGLSDDKQGRKEAIAVTKSLLGLTNNTVDLAAIPKQKSDEERKREIAEDEAKRIRTANWLWDMGSETDGREQGLAYLKGRGITA